MHPPARTRRAPLQPIGNGEGVVGVQPPEGGGGGPDRGGERTSGRREVMFGLVFVSI